MKRIGILLVIALFLASSFAVAYETPSVVLTRTNPGVIGKRNAELIFSVANRDMGHQLEGYILCRTPDDARVVAVQGAGEGDAAQYIGPLQTISEGPKLMTMSVSLEADTTGDKKADCQYNYIPVKIELASKTEDTPFEATKDVTTLGTDVEGFIVVLKEYIPEVAAVAAVDTTPAVEAQPAKAKLDVDGTEAEIEVGKSATVNALTITLNSADAEKANIKLEGKKTTEAGTTTKKYRTMQGTYVLDPENHYNTIRLDKVVPFVEDMTDPQCPEGKSECQVSEVVDVGGMKVPIVWIVIAVIVIILIVAYLLGKSNK